MKAAFVVFDRMTTLDFVGFYDPVTRLASMKIVEDFEWRVCAPMRSIVDDRGLRLEADAVGEPLEGYDLLFVPGGFGTRSLQHDAAFVAWLKTASATPLKVSVCTGALLLGAAGFLQGRRATTHPNALEELAPYCATVARERVVDEGEVITAGGVASALDAGLHVVERLAGAEARQRVAAQMDYPCGSASSGAPARSVGP
ncbi:MAG TPA: DJ-1/PfpI family protein [Burkholderiales bacterium]|nr:DJ-1/PfpI family protein [Burkholderiales bacterium]